MLTHTHTHTNTQIHTYIHTHTNISYIYNYAFHDHLAWRCDSVMDCHATAGCSIPDGNGVKTELHVLRKCGEGGI